MKKQLLTGLIAVLLLGACKKDHVSTFNTASTGYYLYQSITFNNTSGGGASSWDFGDGTKSTLTSPTHAYNQPGDFTVTLTSGTSVATKKITIYHGSAAFQIDNETSQTIPSMFTFTADASGYELHYIDQGDIGSKSKGTIYYTTDSVIYVGGTVPGEDTLFIVAPPHYPYVLTKNTVNLLQIKPGDSYYTLQSIPDTKTKIQDIQVKAFAQKKQASFKRIAQ